MSFIGSILLLATLVSGVLFPIFVGHGLSSGNPTKMLVGVGCLALAAILGTAFAKVTRGASQTEQSH